MPIPLYSELMIFVTVCLYMHLCATKTMELARTNHCLDVASPSLSNQTVHPKEDVINKSYWPLPSQRLLLRKAKVLRWVIIPLCLLLSSMYGLKVV